MKGIFEITESFLKIVQTVYIIAVLLAIFFTLNQYNLYFIGSRLDREALIVGDAALSASCLAESAADGTPIKGLLSKANIVSEISRQSNTISCLPYTKAIYIQICEKDCSLTTPLHSLGDPIILGRTTTYNTTYPAAYDDGTKVIPVHFQVFVG